MTVPKFDPAAWARLIPAKHLRRYLAFSIDEMLQRAVFVHPRFAVDGKDHEPVLASISENDLIPVFGGRSPVPDLEIHLVRDCDPHPYIVARKDREIVGYFAGGENFVRPRHRRQGIGTCLSIAAAAVLPPENFIKFTQYFGYSPAGIAALAAGLRYIQAAALKAGKDLENGSVPGAPVLDIPAIVIETDEIEKDVDDLIHRICACAEYAEKRGEPLENLKPLRDPLAHQARNRLLRRFGDALSVENVELVESLVEDTIAGAAKARLCGLSIENWKPLLDVGIASARRAILDRLSSPTVSVSPAASSPARNM